jgi:NADH:ubiquinone oxidoreductase subunit H
MYPSLSYVFRLLPALANAMAMACLTAFSFVGGWLVPIDPSFFQSSTSVLILLLTIDWLAPFLSGMIFLLLVASIEYAFHQSRRCNRIEIRVVSITLFAMRLFGIRETFPRIPITGGG